MDNDSHTSATADRLPEQVPVKHPPTETKPRFVDVSGAAGATLNSWPPVIYRAADIGAEIERLARLPRPVDGRRAAMFVHPASTEPGLGLTPGIRVTLSVLLPGERTSAIRHNSTLIDFCIRGSGFAVVGDRQIPFSRYDAWNTPSYRHYWYENDGSEIQVRLTYSNAPLLEKLNVHIVDAKPSEEGGGQMRRENSESDTLPSKPLGALDVGSDGAQLLPYEMLINPPAVESLALKWPWSDVKARLQDLESLGAEYEGRRLYLLYNPMTGRTNGTTPSFFATLTLRPPRIVDRPHRHVSTAINYFFEGSGYSMVGGRRYDWGPGDLMFTAPGWVVHSHASGDSSVFELTIQDQPLNIAMESLLWQENLSRPAVLLGSQPGFSTNRADVSTRIAGL